MFKWTPKEINALFTCAIKDQKGVELLVVALIECDNIN